MPGEINLLIYEKIRLIDNRNRDIMIQGSTNKFAFSSWMQIFSLIKIVTMPKIESTSQHEAAFVYLWRQYGSKQKCFLCYRLPKQSVFVQKDYSL